MAALDDKDHALLEALRTDARASLVALSRKIGLSRSATHDRIAKLEGQGVIEGYTIRVNEQAVPRIRAFIALTFSGTESNTGLIPRIQSKPGVAATYCLAGDIDMLVLCECRTNAQLNELREALAGLDGVVEARTRPVLASHDTL